MGKYGNFWEMRYRNPFAQNGVEQVFKCTKCHSESFPRKGWDGSPDTHRCSRDCQMDHSNINGGTRLFKENLAKIFPNSPGADI